MKMTLMLSLFTVLFSGQAHAGKYSCALLKISSAAPEIIGQITVDPNSGQLQKIYLNGQKKEYAGCGTIKNDDGTQHLYCVFGDESSVLKRAGFKNQLVILKQNRLTGAFTGAPVAFTRVGAEELFLLLPGTSLEIYATACLPEGRKLDFRR